MAYEDPERLRPVINLLKDDWTPPDAFMVADPRTGKRRMACGECWRAPSFTGHYAGRVSAIVQPSRARYKTAAGYEKAVQASRTCPECGGVLDARRLRLAERIEAGFNSPTGTGQK